MNVGNDLKLSDYDKIITPFCFLDETGLLNSERDRFFSIGMVKCSRPYEMLTEIEKIRHRQNYTEEAKWQKIFPNNLPIYKMMLIQHHLINRQIIGEYFLPFCFFCIILPVPNLFDFRKHFIRA